jgi:hypothetical protein
MQPNTFIIGAPKCGTTAMARYLAGHPQVFMSAVKEPHYYATDLPGLRYATEHAEYLKLFSAARPDQTHRGEASVYYLYSETAVPNLLRDEPEARLIVMLRNPVELAPALHAEHGVWLVEDVPDFATAWRLQPARARGEQIPSHCLDPRVLQYADVASLGTQMERLLKVVDRRQLQIILFDDFAANTAQAFAETVSFLGLPEQARSEFPRVNSSSRYRWSWMQWLTHRQRFPAWFRIWGRKIGLHKVHDWLHAVNTYAAPRPALSAEMRRELVECFRPEVEKLGDLLQRDLGHWLTVGKEQEERREKLGVGV